MVLNPDRKHCQTHNLGEEKKNKSLSIHFHLPRFGLKEQRPGAAIRNNIPPGISVHFRPEDKLPAWEEGSLKHDFGEFVITDGQENH